MKLLHTTLIYYFFTETEKYHFVRRSSAVFTIVHFLLRYHLKMKFKRSFQPFSLYRSFVPFWSWFIFLVECEFFLSFIECTWTTVGCVMSPIYELHLKSGNSIICAVGLAQHCVMAFKGRKCEEGVWWCWGFPLTAWRISAQNAALSSAQPSPEWAVQAGEVTSDHAGVCRKGLLQILLGMGFHSFWV